MKFFLVFCPSCGSSVEVNQRELVIKQSKKGNKKIRVECDSKCYQCEASLFIEKPKKKKKLQSGMWP